MNSIMSGYLDHFVKGFFGKNNWPRSYVVLTNVGLLYFKGKDFDHVEDVGFVPINVDDLRVVEIDPNEVGGAMTVFSL